MDSIETDRHESLHLREVLYCGFTTGDARCRVGAPFIVASQGLERIESIVIYLGEILT